MTFSSETQEKIKQLFKQDMVMGEKILSGDADAIREMGNMAQRGMSPEEIVLAFESNDQTAINNIYMQGKRLVELKQLYKDLCMEYCYKVESKNETISNNGSKKR